MAKRIFLALMCAALLTAAHAQQQKDYLLRVEDFTEITLADNVNIVYKNNADSAGYTQYNCRAEIAPAFTFTNNKGRLKIEIISDTPVPEPYPTITVYSTSLTKATNLGDSTLCLLSMAPTEKLSLKVMGNGTIQAVNAYATEINAAMEAGSGHVFVSGQASKSKITLAGTGSIEAGGLLTANTTVWLLGTGSVDCSVSEHLSIYGAGSGTVYYSGQPSIKKRSMGVKLVNMDH